MGIAARLVSSVLLLTVIVGVCRGEPESAIGVREAADRIDTLLATHRPTGEAANAPLPDAAFARRVYLDIAGRIPASEELQAFLQDTRASKRALLIDTLLSSPSYQSSMFHFWADLLRAKSKVSNNVSGEPYLHWIKASLAENKPYDVMIRELISANGPAHERNNGATGYYLRDRGMPLDNMANTMRVFAGTRIECAQCHNHPFEDWTQRDFFGLAAFSGGIRYKVQHGDSPTGQALKAAQQSIRDEFGRVGEKSLAKFLRSFNAGITGTGTGLVRLPHDYQYDDAEQSSIIPARAIFGDKVDLDLDLETILRRDQRARAKQKRKKKKKKKKKKKNRPKAPEIGSRSAFADWLTSPHNPRFGRVIANRIWKRAFGRGIIEPVDDIRDSSVPSNPALMEYLEELMVELGYDLRAFSRVLYNTDSYQREATRAAVPLDATYGFPGPLLRRMTGEQMWDSLLTLAVEDVDATLAAPDAKAEAVYTRYEDITAMSAEDFRAKAGELAARTKDPQGYKAKRKAARRAEKAAAKEAMANERKANKPLYRQLNKARRKGQTAEVERIVAELVSRGLPVPGQPRRGKDRKDKKAKRLVRASDLRSPAPPGHLLRQFGQSDREQIDGATAEPTVPQVLTLLNGFLEDHVLANDRSALMSLLTSTDDPVTTVELAFTTILGRAPSTEERSTWVDLVREGGRAAHRDMVWTLVNSLEFRFIQ